MNEYEARAVAPCGHCGHDTPQEYRGEVTGYNEKGQAFRYLFVQCLTCDRGLLYVAVSRDAEKELFRGSQLFIDGYVSCWPAVSGMPAYVPDKIRKVYTEACAVGVKAPNAFANQIRRGLEAICRDRGAQGKVLADQLKDLSSKGEIPATLSEMTDVLRKLGNIGSHLDDDEEIEPEYVPVMDEFFRAVIEYVYIGPHKVAEFRTKLASAKKKAGGGNPPTT